MMNWRKRLIIKIGLMTFFVIMTLGSCTENNNTSETIVAEVGSAKLTETELIKRLGNGNKNPRYRAELIRDWVETEVLSQTSESRSLLNDDNFNNIISQSENELSAAIAIKDYLDNNRIEYSESEIRKYFNENKEDFNFVYDAYILNLVEFNNEENAINFRTNVLNEGWTNALKKIDSDTSVVSNEINRVFKLSEIQSKRIQRVLQRLNDGEVSLVIKTELNNFVIVQQNNLIQKNSIPNFRYVKNDVERSFIALKQKELVRKYLDSLITEMDVKIY